MPDSSRPRSADPDGVGLWLTMHDLTDAEPTPLLATRLAVRRRARVVGSILLALFLIAIALIYSVHRGPERRTPLLLLTAVVVALVVGQSLLDRWVRQVDRRAGATLSRRVAHPGRLGWRTVVGAPRAAFAIAMVAGTGLLAIGALTTADPAQRYAAVILLIGLCGVVVVTLAQLRHVLTYAAVADDEASLTADAIMRVEDAREVTVPSVIWCLPVVSLLDTVPGWWVVAWMTFVVLSVVALILITMRTPSSSAVAQQALRAPAAR